MIATLSAALRSAQHCTAPHPSAAQRAPLHSAHTARSISQRPAPHCTEHSEPRQGRSQQANQAYTARSATQRAALHSTQRYTAPSASLRPALHCAQRFTAPSATLRTALHSAQHCTAPPPPALHSAQHCTAPSTTLHRAQRAKTRPNAATEPSRLRKGGCCVFFVRLAPMRTVVRTPELAPCA